MITGRSMNAFQWAILGYVTGLGFLYVVTHYAGLYSQQLNTRIARAVVDSTPSLTGDDQIGGSRLAGDETGDRRHRRRVIQTDDDPASRAGQWERSVLLLLPFAVAGGWFLVVRHKPARAQAETAPVAMSPYRWQSLVLWIAGGAALLYGIPEPGLPQSLDSFVPLAVASIFVCAWAWLRFWAYIAHHEPTPRGEILVACILPALLQVKLIAAYLRVAFQGQAIGW